MNSVLPEVAEYPQQVSRFYATGENFGGLFSAYLYYAVYRGETKLSDRHVGTVNMTDTTMEFYGAVQLVDGQMLRVQKIEAYDAEHQDEPFVIWTRE